MKIATEGKNIERQNQEKSAIQKPWPRKFSSENSNTSIKLQSHISRKSNFTIYIDITKIKSIIKNTLNT